jgi:hypothetical protein
VCLGKLRDFLLIAADKYRVRHHAIAILELNAALLPDRNDGPDQMLVHAHAPGDAVHYHS